MSSQLSGPGACARASGQSSSTLLISIAAVLVVGIIAFTLLAGSGVKVPDAETTSSLILPVANIKLSAAPAVPKGAKTGEQVVTAICGACHNTGAAGAPKVGDNAAWAPRLGLGLDGLTKSAIAGKNAMPARGGGADLTDEEIARAIAFMANKSGASFKEPPVAAAK
ncbi:MAG TPA: c-type cytochrome [Rhodocyclaceae bacterium]|nr:c-type cytochrome [Rhodocyclaceae bacterium]HNC62532.1 c-type cytochrome [Rhodocyclaceae bacterium]HNH13472.1 c-type cytochrome [Rhodocyclaceae bacterium]HNH98233.1 c-type cytochrome [Rhodocyclaceae bacterium]